MIPIEKIKLIVRHVWTVLRKTACFKSILIKKDFVKNQKNIQI